jgi:hypothetical protein
MDWLLNALLGVESDAVGCGQMPAVCSKTHEYQFKKNIAKMSCLVM